MLISMRNLRSVLLDLDNPTERVRSSKLVLHFVLLILGLWLINPSFTYMIKIFAHVKSSMYETLDSSILHMWKHLINYFLDIESSCTIFEDDMPLLIFLDIYFDRYR
jgi:hypothetical protein